MNKHTPTPWKVSGEVSNWIVTKKGDMPILQARGLAFSVGEAKANAEYVVLCVNSHEALVQALKTARNAIDGNYFEKEVLIIDAALAAAGAPQ